MIKVPRRKRIRKKQMRRKRVMKRIKKKRLKKIVALEPLIRVSLKKNNNNWKNNNSLKNRRRNKNYWLKNKLSHNLLQLIVIL